MEEQVKSESAKIKYKILQKFLLRNNENLLSFLCGIFSNIPITLLFAVNAYGKNSFAHAYFFVWIGAFVYSIIVTVCAFAVTLKKLDIRRVLDQNTLVTWKEDKVKEKVEDKALRRFFYIYFVVFMLGVVLLVCSAIALWVLYNFAVY